MSTVNPALAPAPWFRFIIGSDPIRRAIYIAGMAPAIWYFYLAITDGLGVDPQKNLERLLGLWALRFLMASLAITPLRQLGGPNLIRYRRALGLLAFYYAVLHLGVYLLIDQELAWNAILADVVKRPFITIGMLAFVLLVPLAVTSNNIMIRRLGAETWRKLHRLAYIAAIAAIVHFLMLIKTLTFEPALYATLIAMLLLFRLVKSAMPKKRVRHARS